jgi:lactate racemase
VRIELAYGSDGLTVDLPDDRTTVVEPLHPQAAADARAAVLEALRRPVAGAPLRDVVRGRRTVAISICDGTRPQPREIVVPALLEELEGLVRLEDVVVLVATGTHRGNTPEELRAMLGDEVLAAVRVVNHDSRDEGSLTWMGRHGADVPVWLNSEWVAADVRVTTGFVEPHFFAGFSGGPKLVAPGLAGLETTLTLHDAARIGHPAARWGVTQGNPVHDDVRAIAAATGTDFALDVVLDGEQRIARAFGGELFGMHEAACALVRQTAMRAVPAPFDVVLTTNSGFPLDQNLYQAVKGMSAAAQVVRDGGTIVCAAECRDGFPAHGPYREELTAAASPAALLAAIAARTRTVADQWQI